MAKIEAKKFVEDVRNGKNDSELMKKHEINEEDLKRNYKKLVAAGLLSRQANRI